MPLEVKRFVEAVASLAAQRAWRAAIDRAAGILEGQGQLGYAMKISALADRKPE
jgi:hypothetical protein